MPKVLITGATGFIGGSVAIFLKQRGFRVIGMDYFSDPHMLEYLDEFYPGDFIDNLYKVEQVNLIVHCAGTSLVGPSISEPMKYYYNNVGKTILLLDWIVKTQVDSKLIFSSSASVYKSGDILLHEDSPVDPISPYAKTKKIIEDVIWDYHQAYRINYTIFRYFNACGSFGVQHGQRPNSTHIFPRLFESAKNNRTFILNGDDYKTPDGTCVRDYIHVRDLAHAHYQAYVNNVSGILNLGSGCGYSNRSIIQEVEKALGKKIEVEVVGRRQGDSGRLVSDITLSKSLLQWSPSCDLEMIIEDLQLWYNSKNFGK